MLPLIETQEPKSSPDAPSDAVSLAVWCPNGARSSEHVGRSLLAVGADRGAPRSDHHRVAADRNRKAEIVVRHASGWGELSGLGHVCPSGAGLSEHVGHPQVVVGPTRSRYHRVAADRNRVAEAPRLATGCGELRGLGHVRPTGNGLTKHVGCPLQGVGADRGVRCSNHHRVAADRNRGAKIVAHRAIGCGERGSLGHVRPTGARLAEHVGRSLRDAPVGRRPVRSDHHRVAADRNREAEVVKHLAIGCGELGDLSPNGAGPREHVGRPPLGIGSQSLRLPPCCH